MLGTTALKNEPKAAHTQLTPAGFICLDIETCHASEKVIAAASESWTPPANVKDPDKIEQKRVEAMMKIREKSALLDASPIGCISARTEREGRVFNGINKKEYKVNHSEVIPCGDEKGMLEEFRTWLDGVTTDDTVLIGFNHISFDLPRLRAGYIRHRLKLPRILAPRLLEDERQPAVDVMRLYLKWFTAENHREIFISLDEVARGLGLPSYKDRIDGSVVPDFIKDGKIKEVLTYCAVDTMATLQAYLLMTSTAKEME